MASLVALQAPCGAICSGILSAVNKQYRNSFFNQGVGQIWVATMGHFSVAISKEIRRQIKEITNDTENDETINLSGSATLKALAKFQ